MAARPIKTAAEKNIAVEEVQRVRDRLADVFPEKPQTISARSFIAQLAPDIKRALNNRYTLDQIAERISALIAESNAGKPKSKHISVSRWTIRGYIWGKDSVLKEPDVVRRLEEEGLSKPAGPKKTPPKAASNVTRLGKRTAKPTARKKKSA